MFCLKSHLQRIRHNPYSRALRWVLVSLLVISNVTASERPNILFIAIDDLNDWGIPGKRPDVKTPNLDRLAARGVSFEKAYCAAPACNPSRFAVLSGVRPSTSGVYYNQQDPQFCENLEGVISLPHHFQDQGYITKGGGKIYHGSTLGEWAYTGNLDPEPWDVYFPSKQKQFPEEVSPATFPANGNPKFYRGFLDWAPLSIPDKEMSDAKVVAWASDTLAREHKQPLFLAVGIYRPHIPWYTPQRYYDLYPKDEIQMPKVSEDDLADVPPAGIEMTRRTWHEWMDAEGKWRDAVQAYLASVTFADAMVGLLLDALENGPLAENTVVVLWSDHGYHLGHKEHWEKFALWEQTTHVPLILSGPGLSRGSVCHNPVSLLDIYPTLVELTETTSREHLDGVSLVPWLQDPSATSDRAVVTTQGFLNHAVRSAEYRYIKYADGSEELYNHRTDPNEFTNLASDASLQAVIKQHREWLPKINANLSPLKTIRKKK